MWLFFAWHPKISYSLTFMVVSQTSHTTIGCLLRIFVYFEGLSFKTPLKFKDEYSVMTAEMTPAWSRKRESVPVTISHETLRFEGISYQTGLEVHMGKNCAQGLKCDRGRTFKRHRTPFFSHVDRPGPVNNFFFHWFDFSCFAANGAEKYSEPWSTR